jgi:Secretion system C-terminal sorting domain/Fibronectin type III domain
MKKNSATIFSFFKVLFTLILFHFAVSQTTAQITYTVRASGTSGTEQIQLKVAGILKQTWTLSTTLTTYTVSASAGTARIEFINDATNRDVTIDYLQVNSTVYQSENQAINTGFYANGSCGGGSNSEIMHCNGYIEYAGSGGTTTTNCAGSCPAGYTLFLCGQCWVDQAQATSGGCTQTCTTTTATAPAAPSNLTAITASNAQINLTWADNSSNETGFLVERATGTGAFAQIASLGAGVTSYSSTASSTALSASTSYSFRVRATNATGNSAYSNTATSTTSGVTNTLPTAPSSLSASVASNTQINLSWTDNSTNENGFLVERATGSGAFAQIVSLGANITTYSNTGLVAGTAYNFRVRANNAVGNSAYSNTASATTTNTTSSSISGKFTPPSGKTMLIIGQDLASVTDYTNAANGFPVPAGVTTYLSLWNLSNSTQNYGAIGLDNSLTPLGATGDLDWGGGPLNAYSSAVAWTNSTLQIGLYMVEDGTTKTVNNNSILGNVAQIANGNWDTEIIKLKGFFRKIAPKPVYLRIGYEFDGSWNHYDRTNYIAAFKHIVDIMRSNTTGGTAVTNVANVWQACASPFDDLGEKTHENIGDWYPGDAYVDWVALSWFLLPNELPLPSVNAPYTPATQTVLAKEVVDFGVAHSKPVMIAESTPQGYKIINPTCTNANISIYWDGAPSAGAINKTGTEVWNEWFTPFFNFIHANSNAIRAVSYINANWDSQGLWKSPYPQGYWGDTRVQNNPTVKTNWNNEVSSTFWISGSSTLFGQLSSARIAAIENEVEDTFDIGFYPNPNSKGVLYTDGLKVGMEYQITDMMGLPKVTKDVTTDNESINISTLKTGTYIINVTDNQKKIAKKIVVE